MGIRHTIAVMLALSAPMPALAHPHLFVETRLTLLFEGETPVGVQVDWIYDDFFSLLLTSDLGIDLDGDMVLTSEEQAQLQTAVTTWPENFNGDLEVRQDGQVVALGQKVAHKMGFQEGIITESHVRVLPAMSDGPIVLQAFDPFYYVAYDLTVEPRVFGRENCDVTVTPADMQAARAMAADLLGGLAPEDVGPEEDFPPIGSAFADTVTITCD